MGCAVGEEGLAAKEEPEVKVATKGRHRFIDKVHVRYVEREKRHWAALENFNSQRIAVPEKFYRDYERLLEGGIWAEVTIAYNEIDEDDYTFYVEDLRPIQLSRFDFEGYMAGSRAFTRDEWLDAVLRSVGLEPARLSQRQKLHVIARLAPLAEPNFNFIEQNADERIMDWQKSRISAKRGDS